MPGDVLEADKGRFQRCCKNCEMLEYNMKKAEGCHNGGDNRLRRMLFRNDIPDPPGQFADSGAGARSIMIGICTNKSIAERKPFLVRELLDKKLNLFNKYLM